MGKLVVLANRLEVLAFCACIDECQAFMTLEVTH